MSRKRLRAYEDFLRSIQRVVDLLTIVGIHALAAHLYDQPWRREMASATVLAIVMFTVVSEVTGTYRSARSDEPLAELKNVLGAWLITVAGLAFFMFATKTATQYSRVISFGWLGGVTLALAGWRLAQRLVLRVLWSRKDSGRPVAIVGATPSGERLCEQIRERPWLGLRIVGIFDDRAPNRRHAFAGSPCEHIGGTKELVEACRTGAIDVVYVALPLGAEKRIGELLAALSNTTATVYLVADVLSYDLLSARWTAIGSSPLVSIHDTPFRGISGGLKRLEDIVAGIVALFLIAMPMLVIAIAVKVTSPGPVFFRQRRYGLNGKEIRVLKFRTMTVCEDGCNVQQAKPNDSRVTPLGRFLRRTSLDELPQFLQVLTGEMSVVGPRPHAVAHNEQYRSLIPGYMLRHKVKPGITGWAQVNGWRGETPDISWMQKRVEHDLEYIDNWSFFWDLKIVLLTILSRRSRRNAF